MNTKYKKMQADPQILKKLETAVEAVKDLEIPADIPHGDMPGDKIEIGESHIAKARKIFPELVKELKEAMGSNPYHRAVVAVCGGSGVGKSEIASLLSYLLSKAGIGSYTMSGDNYPHRIPSANDEERLHVFREGGMRQMARDGFCDRDSIQKIRDLQVAEDDANEAHVGEFPCFASYLKGGREALGEYLGTPRETDFAEVDSILAAFRDGAKSLKLRRMGRDESTLWYDEVDMSTTRVLLLEWTHGNSDHMQNVNIPVLLNSTPEETLEHRRSRNRDGKLDSPFTMLVLHMEQEKLKSQAHKARIIITKSGELIDFDTFTRMMAE